MLLGEITDKLLATLSCGFPAVVMQKSVVKSRQRPTSMPSKPVLAWEPSTSFQYVTSLQRRQQVKQQATRMTPYFTCNSSRPCRMGKSYTFDVPVRTFAVQAPKARLHDQFLENLVEIASMLTVCWCMLAMLSCLRHKRWRGLLQLRLWRWCGGLHNQKKPILFPEIYTCIQLCDLTIWNPLHMAQSSISRCSQMQDRTL